MSFLSPKPPKVVSTPAATPAVQANADTVDSGLNASGGVPSSLISTSSQGLTKKASTRKPSLIGGTTGGN